MNTPPTEPMGMSLGRLFEHSAWANEKILAALETAEVESERARWVFAHLLEAEYLWMQRIRGEPASKNFWPSLSLGKCAELARRSAQEYSSAIAHWTPEDLTRPIRYRNSKDIEYVTPLGEILLHVALHGSYHRGQIASALRAAGASPPLTDYIAYTREPAGGIG